MASPSFELRHITPQTIRRGELSREETAALAGAALLAVGIAAGIGIGAYAMIRRARRRRMADQMDIVDIKPER